MARIIQLLILLSLLLTPSESYLIEAINYRRADQGLSVLQTSDYLTELARMRSQQACELVRAGVPWGPSLHTMPNGHLVFWMLQWPTPYYGGEIIGRTNLDIANLINAFMESPAHKRCILSPHYDFVGAGEATDGDVTYMAVLFVGWGKTISSGVGRAR